MRKNQRLKISFYCPFKIDSLVSSTPSISNWNNNSQKIQKKSKSFTGASHGAIQSSWMKKPRDQKSRDTISFKLTVNALNWRLCGRAKSRVASDGKICIYAKVRTKKYCYSYCHQRNKKHCWKRYCPLGRCYAINFLYIYSEYLRKYHRFLQNSKIVKTCS